MIVVLLLVAVFATVYATASWLTGFNDDFTAAALVAITALAVVFLTKQARYTREIRRDFRDEVWARRARDARNAEASGGVEPEGGR